MRTTVGELVAAGLEGCQTSGLRKTYKI